MKSKILMIHENCPHKTPKAPSKWMQTIVFSYGGSDVEARDDAAQVELLQIGRRSNNSVPF